MGVELAGEIVEKHPMKSVTIIQSGDKLLSSSTGKNERMKVNARKALEARGVKLMFGEVILLLYKFVT